MRKVLIIIFLFFITQLRAQQPVVSEYTPNLELDKFVGTWLWISGKDTLKVVLVKQKLNIASLTSKNNDALVGWYEYIKQGIVQESDLEKIGTPCTGFNIGVSSSLLGNNKRPDQIYFSFFHDLKNDKYARLYLTMLPNTIIKAKWQLRNPNKGIKPGDFILGFSLPTDVVLTKQ